MATATVEFDCPQGLTLTLELYADGGDTLSATQAATERTNDKGNYTASVVDLASGLYRARAKLADGTTIGRGLLQHVNAAGRERVEGCGDVPTSTRASQASVTALGAGTGARTVTITVDDGTNPIDGALVRLTKGGESYTKVANASGVAVLNVDDGTWTVSITAANYSFAGASLVVDGTETQTYSMTAISITAPAAVSLCTVQFRVKLSDTAVAGAVCKARLLGINQASDGTILSNAESSDTTDATGVAELQLVRRDQITKGSGRYKLWVEIDDTPVASVETTIPNQATVLFEDILGV